MIIVISILLTTQNLTPQNFVARLAQANLAGKNYIAALGKKTDFVDKLC